MEGKLLRWDAKETQSFISSSYVGKYQKYRVRYFTNREVCEELCAVLVCVDDCLLSEGFGSVIFLNRNAETHTFQNVIFFFF